MQATDTVGGLRDETEVRAAYAAHGAELYRLAARLLGDPGLAEEAVQETFVRAWRARARYDPQLASLRTWLFAIGRNVVIDLARARAVRSRLTTLSEPDGLPEGDDVDEQVLRSFQLTEAMRRVSEQHRQALVETYLRGRTCAEVAAEVGVPEGTMRTRVFYGLKAMRLVLDEMGWSA